MKKFIQIFTLMGGIACLFYLNSCSENITEDAPDALFGNGNGNGVVEKVTGSGHFTINPDTDSSFKRTFSFNARRYADGSVKGEWQRVRRDDGNASGDAKSHGNILCFTVDGDRAWFGTDAESGILGEGGFWVHDGGNNGKKDSISLQFAGRDPGFADLYCDITVETPALNALEAGNITIH